MARQLRQDRGLLCEETATIDPLGAVQYFSPLYIQRILTLFLGSAFEVIAVRGKVGIKIGIYLQAKYRGGIMKVGNI